MSKVEVQVLVASTIVMGGAPTHIDMSAWHRRFQLMPMALVGEIVPYPQHQVSLAIVDLERETSLIQ